MTRLKDRNLKKKPKNREPKIEYRTLLISGMKDTKENRIRWANGEALDLLTEALEEENRLKIKHNSNSNKVTLSKEFLEDLEQSEKESLEQLNKDTDG